VGRRFLRRSDFHGFIPGKSNQSNTGPPRGLPRGDGEKLKNNTKKQDILRAYAKVIEQCGLEKASLGAVAKEMGINQSLIFHYFENKEDLLRQLTDHVMELCLRSYEKAWPREDQLNGAGFEALVSYVLSVHHNRRRTISPKLYFSLMYLLPRDRMVQERFTAMTETLIGRLACQLERFRAAGVITCTDCAMAAKTIICMADGIFYYSLLPSKQENDAFVQQQKLLYYAYAGYQPNN